MNKKIISILFFIGILTFFVVALLYFVLPETVSDKLFFLLLFLSTCFMLPKCLYDVKYEEEPAQVSWRILITDIIAILVTLCCFIFSLIRNI